MHNTYRFCGLLFVRLLRWLQNSEGFQELGVERLYGKSVRETDSELIQMLGYLKPA
jgi:hypothetical protein